MTAAVAVAATPERVLAVVADYERWPEVFPLIRGVELISAAGGEVFLDVRQERGRVPNHLVRLGDRDIRIDERRRLADAVFTYHAEELGLGSKLVVSGRIQPRPRIGPAVFLLRPYVRARMRAHILLPVKRAAEELGA